MEELLALLRAGLGKLLSVETRDALVSYASKQAGNVGKIAMQRALQGYAVQPGLEYYGVSEATRVAKTAAVKQFQTSSLARFGTLAEQKTHQALLWLSGQAGEKASAAEFRILGGPKGMQDPSNWPGILQNDPNKLYPTLKAYARHQQVLRAYHSPAGRFIRAGTNQFLTDYASYQLVNLGGQLAEEIFPRLGPTDRDDELDWTPYSQVLTSQTERAGSYRGQQGFETKAINIAVTTILGSVISRQVGAYRSGGTTLRASSLNALTSGASFATRLEATTAAARSYYGGRLPEIAGRFIGSTGALGALGGTKKQVATITGIRVASVGASGVFQTAKWPVLQKVAQVQSVRKVKKKI